MTRFNLQVPYAEKDAAKAAGAKWDPTGRTWYSERSHGSIGSQLPELAPWTRAEDRR